MTLPTSIFVIFFFVYFRLAKQDSTCSFSKYPFMIGIKETFSFKHICAGTLIKPDTVLTLASCIIGRKDMPGFFTAVAGPSIVGKIGSQRSIARQIVIHTKFDRTKFSNDVGLLIMLHEFELARLIDIVRIPDEFIPDDLGKLYSKAVAIGWGPYHYGKRLIDDNRYLFDPIMKCIELDILNETNCRKLRKGFGYEPNRICAWVPQGDEESCQGDAGGPLMSDNMQVGIVSMGYGCDSSTNPAFYERVDRVLNIFKQTSESQIEYRSNSSVRLNVIRVYRKWYFASEQVAENTATITVFVAYLGLIKNLIRLS